MLPGMFRDDELALPDTSIDREFNPRESPAADHSDEVVSCRMSVGGARQTLMNGRTSVPCVLCGLA